MKPLLAFFLISADLLHGKEVVSLSAQKVATAPEEARKTRPESLSKSTPELPRKAQTTQPLLAPTSTKDLISTDTLPTSGDPKTKPLLPVSPLRTMRGPGNKSLVLPRSPKSTPEPNSRTDSCSSNGIKKDSSCKKVASLVAGMFFPDIPAYGAFATYGLRPDLNLGAQVVYNSTDIEKNKQINDLYYQNISLRFLQVGGFVLKTFQFSESFYLKPAFSYRVLETGMNGKKNTVNGDFDFSLATKSHYLVASTSLGNRFTFQNRVTLGCDWIGVAVPLSLKKEYSGQYNGTTDPELEATSNRLFRTFQKPHLQLFFISVGWQF
jgi:hypothetical protein